MQIAGLQKSSLLDYPSKIAAVIFTLGCNFRCPYCHNPNLITAVSSHSLFDETAVFNFLKQRQGKLDAVVVSGGEPSLQKDIAEFFRKIKDLGYLAKLDTNGTNPDVIKRLVNEKLVDYIAMDIKSPLNKYEQTVCRSIDIGKISESIEFIMSCGVEYEFRTTVVRSQLDILDFENIGKTLKGAKRYYLQKFRSDITLNPDFSKEQTYTDMEFEKIQSILKSYIDEVLIR